MDIMNVKAISKDKGFDIKSAFVDFMSGRDPLLDMYKFGTYDVLIDVFRVERTGALDKEINIVVFPIGRVLKAGSESIYKENDLVRLNDFDTRTLQNKLWELWYFGPMSKGAAKQVGVAPEEFVSNIHQAWSSKRFIPDPLKTVLGKKDLFTFLVSDAHILCKIDAEVLNKHIGL